MADINMQPGAAPGAGANASQPNQDPASQLLDMQKKKRLASMDMPGASTAPVQGAANPLPDRPADSSAPGYTDPDTGETTPNEPGAQEGEFYTDYFMPIKNLFKGGAVAAANIVGKKGIQALRDRMPGMNNQEETEDSPMTNSIDYSAPGMQAPKNTAQGPGLNYSNQQGVGTTTDATNGFKPGKGYQIRNR